MRQLDMSVPGGSVTGLVGPNGAGKTTLLLMLAALLAPDSGTIRVSGLDPVTRGMSSPALPNARRLMGA